MTPLTLRYLGAAGWYLRAEQVSLLIDPYFTRLSLSATLFSRAIPDYNTIKRNTPAAEAILVTHPHYDHLMDVPEVARITGAQVYASPHGSDLLESLGVPAGRLCPIHPNDVLAIGPFEAYVFATPHRRILGGIPYQGELRRDGRPPLYASDYRLDFHYSFLITANGLRVLVASGIDDEPAVQADVLLVGADATREQLARILCAAQPRWVMPNHWDDMFVPLDQPVRPMLTPPPTLLPTLRRIDLKAFARMACELHPTCEVILPERFRPYRFN